MERTAFSPSLDVVSELTERCDRCGAAARLTCTLPGGELAFCGHHANAHTDSILGTATAIRVLSDFPWWGAAPAGTTVSTVDEWQIVDRMPGGLRPFPNNSR